MARKPPRLNDTTRLYTMRQAAGQLGLASWRDARRLVDSGALRAVMRGHDRHGATRSGSSLTAIAAYKRKRKRELPRE
jgi:hypothetical protein